MRQRPPRQASLSSLRRAWPEAGGKFPSQSRGATLADAGGRSRCESGRERAPAVRVGALRVAGATAEGKVNCPGVSRGGTPADGGGRRILKGARGQLAHCRRPEARGMHPGSSRGGPRATSEEARKAITHVSQSTSLPRLSRGPERCRIALPRQCKCYERLGKETLGNEESLGDYDMAIGM